MRKLSKNKFFNYFLFFLSCSVLLVSTDSFKNNQKKHARVKKAYEEKENGVLNLLSSQQVSIKDLEIYLRAFKKDKIIELWAKNKTDTTFKLIKEYKICSISGTLGPKRKQGDLQIPEGFYHINRFNPTSNFYLSLGINYPNKSDKIFSNKENPGGDIFIHGACVTIGCLPITDNEIKELYIFCVEAKNAGQQSIPVTIFPVKLTEGNLIALKQKYSTNENYLNLWNDLKKGFDTFNLTKQLPNIEFLNNGRHIINY